PLRWAAYCDGDADASDAERRTSAASEPRRQAAASRARQDEYMGTPSASFAPWKGDAPGVRFPDSRHGSAFAQPSQAEAQWRSLHPGHRAPEARIRRGVAAYSGGTAWAFHPLRVAAGVPASRIASLRQDGGHRSRGV